MTDPWRDLVQRAREDEREKFRAQIAKQREHAEKNLAEWNQDSPFWAHWMGALLVLEALEGSL